MDGGDAASGCGVSRRMRPRGDGHTRQDAGRRMEAAGSGKERRGRDRGGSGKEPDDDGDRRGRTRKTRVRSLERARRWTVPVRVPEGRWRRIRACARHHEGRNHACRGHVASRRCRNPRRRVATQPTRTRYTWNGHRHQAASRTRRSAGRNHVRTARRREDQERCGRGRCTHGKRGKRTSGDATTTW